MKSHAPMSVTPFRSHIFYCVWPWLFCTQWELQDSSQHPTRILSKSRNNQGKRVCPILQSFSPPLYYWLLKVGISWWQSVGANVSQKLFKGFATTAAVREGHVEILEILIKSGASQPACEEALLEASSHGRARPVELLMGSDLIRPHISVHALVTACCRGYVDVVDTLLKVNHLIHWFIGAVLSDSM